MMPSSEGWLLPCSLPPSPCPLPPVLGYQPVPAQVLFVQHLHCNPRRDAFPWDVAKENPANNTVSPGDKTANCGQLEQSSFL